jgi:hypothetical protein
MACQIALLFPSVSALRIVIRSISFVVSFLFALLLTGRSEIHPSRRLGVVAIVIVGLSIFHPDTNNLVSGVATVVLYASILAPLLWVPRIRLDAKALRTLFFLFWIFHSASAGTGVLQMYFPGRFQPATASVLSDSYLEALQITLANGQKVLRPMGLTDTPGGAAVGGLYAILFAGGFLLDRPRPLFRMALLLSIGLGCFSIYISQVRVMLVMTIIGLVGMAIPAIRRGRLLPLLKVTAPAIAIGIVSLSIAIAVGGDQVTSRLNTLLASDPQNVYYTNRGSFLESTIVDLVPSYPIGAGLGRWGMMYAYFADRHGTPPFWVEIQWTGWLFDGGILLVVLYALAITMAILTSMRIATSSTNDSRSEIVSKWGTLVTGYSLAVLASAFDACPFMTTQGVDFWLLNAAVFAAWKQAQEAQEDQVEAHGAVDLRRGNGGARSVLRRTGLADSRPPRLQ